jgi:hypothetical protein
VAAVGAHLSFDATDRLQHLRIAQMSTWVVDMRHYLDEETGDLPDSVPGPVLNLALFFGSIVAWVTGHLPESDWHTNVSCRRSPGRKRCRGEIVAELDRSSGHIVWHCSVCGDNGLIHGWEDTLWNRHGGVSANPRPYLASQSVRDVAFR